MAEDVEIRRCTEADLSDVAALFQAWQDEDSVWGLRAEPAERLRGRMGEFFFVARVGGRAAGFAVGKLDDEPFCIYPNGETYLEVEDVFVAADFRGRGVGTALMKSLIAAAESKGIPRFHLYSASKRWQHSAGFYERFGFQVWAFQMFRK